MRRSRAFAKINLGLVVGPVRADGKHEIVTLLQRIDLHDDVTVEHSDVFEVDGYAEDTIVRAALQGLAGAVGVEPSWRVHIEKRIPVAAGLGGGSSDAATALSLANALLDEPLERGALDGLAARVGADVPFFLREGAQLASGDGSTLEPVSVPVDYHVVLVVPTGVVKHSTGAVYDAFDRDGDATGFGSRAEAFRSALASVETASDLGRLPENDLASSELADSLRAAGAFRADVSGAGPTVYGLFGQEEEASAAAATLTVAGETVVTRPVAR